MGDEGLTVSIRAPRSVLARVLLMGLVASLLATLPASRAAAQPTESDVVDQRVDGDPACNAQQFPASTPVTSEFDVIAQEFTPQLSTLTAVDLCLEVFSTLGEGEVTIVELDENGDVVANVAEPTSFNPRGPGVLGGGIGWNHVALDEAVELVPGTRYAIRLETPRALFDWRSTCGDGAPCGPASPDRYPRGKAVPEGDPSDFGFRTYAASAPNLTIGDVGAPELVCPDPATLATVTIRVDNVAAQGVDTFDVALRLGDTALGRATVHGGLGAGASVTLSADDFDGLNGMTALAGRQRSALIAVVDPDATIPSEVTDDNEGRAPTTVVECAAAELTDLRLTADTPAITAGLVEIPFAALDGPPVAASAARFSEVTSTPFQATPFQATPFQATPFQATPFQATPFQATPFQATPFQATPFQATPFQATPFQATQLDTLLQTLDDEVLDQVLLASVAAFDVDERLRDHAAAHEGTQTATTVDALLQRPAQDLTLADVLRRLAPPLPIGLHEVALDPAFELGLLSIALAAQPLDTIPAPAGHHDWCDAIEALSTLRCGADIDPDADTLLNLDVRSVPMDQLDIGAIRVADIQPPTMSAMFDVYLANPLIAEAAATPGVAQPYRLSNTVLGAMRVTDALTTPGLVPACDGGCDLTMAEAEAQFGFADDLRLGSVINALSPEAAQAFTLPQALLGFAALADLPWARFDFDTVDPTAVAELIDEACEPVTWTATADVATGSGRTAVVDPTLHVDLPAGFGVIRDQVSATVDGQSAPFTLSISDGSPRSVAVTVEGIAESSVGVNVPACGGATLGRYTPTASATYSTLHVDGDAISVVTAALDGTDPASPIAIIERDEPDTPEDLRGPGHESLVVRHITTEEDLDFFRIPLGVPLDDRGTTLDPGDRLRVTMAPPPGRPGSDGGPSTPGHDYDMVVFGPASSPLRDGPLAGTGEHTRHESIIPVRDPSMTADGTYGTVQGDVVNDVPSQSEPVQQAPFQATPFQATPFQATPFQATPFQATPVRATSIARGDAPESADLVVRPGETEGDFTIQVSGFNGDRSSRPYVLFYEVLDAVPQLGECAPPGDGMLPGAGLAPIAEDTHTLLLMNRQLLTRAAITQHAQDPELSANYLTGQDFADAVLDAIDELAAHPAVHGQVVAWEDDPTLNTMVTSYRTTSAWCDPVAANAIVGQLRRVVADARAQAPQLSSVVVIGGDDATPMHRAWDETSVANERSFLAEQLAGLGAANGPSLAALAAGTFLSDDALVGEPMAWRDDVFFVPELPVGRLVETPLDVMRQAQQFVLADGIIDATSVVGGTPEPITPPNALVTGYDFLADGADAAADALSAADIDTARLISDDWTADDLLDALAGDPARVVALLNGHADPTRLLSAAGDAAVREGQSPDPDEVISTADLAGVTLARIVAAASCHFGLNVIDAYASGGTMPTADWAQTLSERQAILIGSTGFGYGTFDEAPALSEGLVADLAAQIPTTATVGHAWARAKQRFASSPAVYGEHHRKSGMQLAFYGLPMYRLSTASTAAGPLPVTPVTDPITGLDVVGMSTGDVPLGGPGCTNCLETVTVDGDAYRGSFLRANGFAGDGVLAVEGQPLTAQATFELDAGGREAGGLFLTDTVAVDVPGPDGSRTFDPLFARPIVSSEGAEREPQTLGSAFPSTVASARTVAGISTVSIPLTRFRGASVDDDGNVVGQMTALTRVEGTLYLRAIDSDDVAPPTTRTISVRRADGALTNRPGEELINIDVTLSDRSGVARVGTALRITTSSSDEVRTLELSRTSDTDLNVDGGGTITMSDWGGGTYVPAGATIELVRAQAVDGAGNVNTAHNKLVTPTIGGTGGTDPELVIAGTLSNGWFGAGAQVLLNGSAASYDVYLDNTLVDTVTTNPNGPTVALTLDGDRVYEVTATPHQGFAADGTTILVPVDSSPPTVTFQNPSEAALADGLSLQAGQVHPLDIDCDDLASGVVSCVADIYRADASGAPAGAPLALDATSLLTATTGRYAILATALDEAGRTTTRQADYTVMGTYSLNGFESPMRPFPQVRSRERGSTLPVKFTATDNEGNMPDPADLRLVWFDLGPGDGAGGCDAPAVEQLDGRPVEEAFDAQITQPLEVRGGRFKANVVVDTADGFVGGNVCQALTLVAPDGGRLYGLVVID